jgi:ADP-dependent NAD(P)H-hydrate dehydratase / NAD(P)H-hydrate epimerase
LRVLKPEEMAAIDREAIEVRGMNGLDLMEKAGEAVAAAAAQMLGASPGSVAVWCGKGNNGGDGLVAARLLSGSGREVKVYLLCRVEELAGDAKQNYRKLEGTKVEILSVEDEKGIEDFKGRTGTGLVIDAIFGTGFRGAAGGVFAAAIEAISRSGSPVLSVDIPSGVSGATGTVHGPAVRAERTVTFAAYKVGLLQYPGAGLAGVVEVADIGIPRDLLEEVPESRFFLVNEGLATSLLPSRRPDAHKWECGSVLVVGGCLGMTGAPAMCARSALRSGAGIVTVAVPHTVCDILEIKLTEGMTRPLAADEEGALSTEASMEVLELCRRFDVLALGPGISERDGAVGLVRRLLPEVPIPVVLDADGLNAVADCSDLLRRRPAPTVLTPHPGEMARLLGCDTGEVQENRIGAALEAARRFECVVLLKGAGSVTCDPGGAVIINSTGNPGMATAGMGDVLTGCVSALMAQGLGAFEAAVAGAYYHGVSADLVAQMDGMIGMVASDVVRHLPLAMRYEQESHRT